uniref:Amino acid permease/ SLC12A domain-containing protein n=1 Tax=Knipowitschia caucasica TaxID=637954 RepID=A0AAV2J5W8_KNICA
MCQGLTHSRKRLLLQKDYSFLRDINIWGPFVTIGVYSSTLSAAMSNLIGASRILYALARDDLFGKALSPAKKTSHSGNPWMSVLISWFLVQLVLFSGKLNTIASIVTIFFLLVYAAVDLACLALEWASAPNFRTIQCFENNKPWITAEVKNVLNKKKRVFGSGDCEKIRELVLFSGKLNTIASIVTIFFLLVYAAVDLACLALEWASAPNFRITYQDTNYRRSIPAEERLSICLRFLATGDSYRTIAGSFRAGISTVSMLIPDVVAAIWDCLVEEFMAVPGAEEWR